MFLESSSQLLEMLHSLYLLLQQFDISSSQLPTQLHFLEHRLESLKNNVDLGSSFLKLTLGLLDFER